MLPAAEDAALRSTAELACDDDADVPEGLAEDVPDGVPAELLEPPVAGLEAAGVVPVLLPQPVRAAARARMATPAPRWCFMVCSLGVLLWLCACLGVPLRGRPALDHRANPYD